ncbi:hypothetical protein MNBD_IGNAVI01-1295 [hydrothermal vent metagenome]|uniref:PpiC domain-containing protein n=1 Tax=hydrothermal vent metagenome TaxID=652676 RepID=A0A3B1C3L8_9ZZZZ
MNFRILFTSVLLGLLFAACATTKHSEIVVAEFGNNDIKMGEFENAYAKNVGGIEAAKKDSLSDYEKFLDLYVPYKMKLRDAFVRGYYQDEDLNKELNDYKTKVGVSYLEEKYIVAPGLKNFYDQRSEEVRASHIMIKRDSTDEAAKKEAQSILDSIKNGASFEKMAAKYSDDRFSKNKGGDIYWFTAGQIIPSFEMAAYSTPVGEVYPEVVKTKFGYHLIKVTDREKRRYKIRASHILIKSTENNRNDSSSALNRITKIDNDLKNGASFDSLAREFSEDPGSAKNGGDLGFFERRQMVKPFDEAVFKLKIGEISPIVKTRFGYHIIKLTGEKEYPPYEEEIEKLREIYKKSRYQYDYDQFIDKLKKEFDYSVNEDLVKLLTKSGDQITLDTEYKKNDNFTSHKDENIITTKNRSVSLDSLLTFMDKKSEYKGKKLDVALLNGGIKKYGNQLLLEEKAATLENTDPEFAKLMDDYRNGIYIFKLQEDEVWNRVKIDSTQLKKLYEETKENYKTPPQVGYSEIFTYKKEKIDTCYQLLKNGEEFGVVAEKYTKQPGMKDKAGDQGIKIVDESETSRIANSLSNIGDFSKPFKVMKGWAIVKLNKKLHAREKTYEEALPELSSAYQEMESKRLEKKYNNKLKELYKPQYFYEELTNAFKPENN